MKFLFLVFLLILLLLRVLFCYLYSVIDYFQCVVPHKILDQLHPMLHILRLHRHCH